MKKKDLLNLFTKDSSYNYHIIRTEEPNGHLIYLMKSGSVFNTDSLEFSTTRIAEELVNECGIKIEKFAPGIFFTDESNTQKLKYELNDKLSENSDFSSFIESIKNEYRILEIKGSLLYKKDPEAYENAKKEEHEEKQKELWEVFKNQLEDSRKRREESLSAFNNDLIKLLKEYFEDVVEFEKMDFDFNSEFEKMISNLINPESWLKIDNEPFSCKVELCSLEKDRMNVFLTDNKLLYTATLKFDKIELVAENFVEISNTPKIMSDYEFLSFLYDINTNEIEEWEFKNDTEKFEYVINLLVPIFKLEKKRKEEEFIKKMREEGKIEFDEN